MVDIVIIDYGIGNVKSLLRSLTKVGGNVEITADVSKIKNADALVLPGVGAFDPAMQKLAPLVPLILDETKAGKPMLGICLGLQLLFDEGEEGTEPGEDPFKGLGIIPGKVIHFPPLHEKIPHMGWNSIQIQQPDHPLYENIPQDSYVYFVHSYFGNTTDSKYILTKTKYEIDFPSSVGNGSVFATQFHPEKSGEVGLNILTNFLNIAKK